MQLQDYQTGMEPELKYVNYMKFHEIILAYTRCQLPVAMNSISKILEDVSEIFRSKRRARSVCKENIEIRVQLLIRYHCNFRCFSVQVCQLLKDSQYINPDATDGQVKLAAHIYSRENEIKYENLSFTTLSVSKSLIARILEKPWVRGWCQICQFLSFFLTKGLR